MYTVITNASVGTLLEKLLENLDQVLDAKQIILVDGSEIFAGKSVRKVNHLDGRPFLAAIHILVPQIVQHQHVVHLHLLNVLQSELPAH